MLHSNKTSRFSIRISYIKFVCSLTTKFDASTISTKSLNLNLSTLSSNTGLKNLKILFPNIFLNLLLPFTYVSYTAIFFKFVILFYPVYFNFVDFSVYLLFATRLYFITNVQNICRFLLFLLPLLFFYVSFYKFQYSKSFPGRSIFFPLLI